MVACNKLCRSATTSIDECECSCNGANHGINHKLVNFEEEENEEEIDDIREEREEIREKIEEICWRCGVDEWDWYVQPGCPIADFIGIKEPIHLCESCYTKYHEDSMSDTQTEKVQSEFKQ